MKIYSALSAVKSVYFAALLAACAATTAQPHSAFIRGSDLIHWLDQAESSSKPSDDDLIAGLRAQGYAMGVVDYLVVAGQVCLPPSYRFADLQPLIRRELAAAPSKYLAGSGSPYVERAVLKAHPCRKP
jgi:hypothetical protein